MPFESGHCDQPKTARLYSIYFPNRVNLNSSFNCLRKVDFEDSDSEMQFFEKIRNFRPPIFRTPL